MFVSLILATLGRTSEVRRLLDSLKDQNFKDFEVIVVDQNDDDRLESVLNCYERDLAIKKIRSLKGLSRARNAGLKLAVGDIVAFPDDDCWYEPDTLAFVTKLFQSELKIDGVTGRFINEMGISEGRWPKSEIEVTRKNVWRTSISFSIFLKREVIQKVGQFDELLGVGAGTPWGSGEETDYLLRALKVGFHLKYFPSLVLRHPVKVSNFDSEELSRAVRYSPGTGRVLKKNNFGLAGIALSVAKCGGRGLQSLLKFEFKATYFYFLVAKGRIKGWLSI